MPEHAVVHPFAAWEGYYVIVGTAAAALTGLQFVVMTLISEFDQPRGTREVAAFGSPTVVHFGSSLLVSGILSAPWPGLRPAGTTLAFAGLGGLIYAAIVLRRALRQKGYQPVFEDWLSHTILPTLAYLAIFAGGMSLTSPDATSNGVPAFLVAGAALLLVFIGIHNSWDTVTWVTVQSREKGTGSGGGIAAGSPPAPPSVPPPVAAGPTSVPTPAPPGEEA